MGSTSENIVATQNAFHDAHKAYIEAKATATVAYCEAVEAIFKEYQAGICTAGELVDRMERLNKKYLKG